MALTDSPTPQQLAAQEADDQAHVTRSEFRALRSDVHEIKVALLGTMTEGGVLEQHRKMRDQMRLIAKVAWAGVIGAAGLIGKALWDKLVGRVG